MNAPDWLLRPEVGLCPCGCIGKRRKGSYVDKTIGDGAAILRRTLFAQDIATEPGLLQRLDPRVKVVTFLGLLIGTGLLRSIPVLVGMYGVTLALAAASRVSLSFLLRRVWLFVPLFTGIVVLPATLNLITPGIIVVPLGTWFGHPLGVTAQGLTAAGLIVVRVATSISLVVLLVVTTPWSDLLAALRALFVPRLFIVVLALAYRYLFQLLSTVIDMFTARKARTVSRSRDAPAGRAFVAASAGALFGKSHALAEEVHMAMVARGFRGDARTSTAFRLRLLDALFGCAALALIIGTLVLDRIVAA